jgi:putative ABC transport system permease protein
MLLNHLRFSLRHLVRQKLNTVLHVAGLTLAMSVCLLIGLFLRYELTFDRQGEKGGRIYRVNSVWKESNKQFDLYGTPLPLAAAIRGEVAGVEKVVMARPQFKSTVEINPQKIFKQDHILIVEPEFADVFDLVMVRGGKAALLSPYQALLDETTAAKYFGKEDPLGKTFKYRNKFIITVAGVFKDLPFNTHLPASVLLSYMANEEFLDHGDTWYFGDQAWTKLAACTYVLLKEKTTPENIQRQLKVIADRNINSSPTLDKNIRGDFELQALKEIHFDTRRFGGGPWVPAVDTAWLWFFAGIGAGVLLLACINFLNLSTAQSMSRAREVGIRKVVGARRSQLLTQFLGEAWIIAAVSGLLAMVITAMAIPYVNEMLHQQVTFQLFSTSELITVLLLFILLTGLLAGVYPAWLIARFNPVNALKSISSTRGANGTSWLRKTLVVAQFVLSAGLLMAVLLIARQASFLKNTHLGFNKENIVNVEVGSADKQQAFSNELMQIRGVKEVSFSRITPISNDHWWNTISVTETSDRKSVCAIHADEHFFAVYGLHLLAGNIPVKNEKSEAAKQVTNRVVVNEKLLKELRLGTPVEAIGKHFWWGGDTEIAAVVADFHTEPLKYAISPTLFFQEKEVYAQANIRLEGGADYEETLQAIATAWKKQFPEGVYEYKFVNDQVNSYYESESRLYMLFRVFAGLAIFISCLGLWGLVAFSAQQRTKEIGIRKVLGASVKAILILFTRDFLVLVVIAFVVAVPFAYYWMNDWLDHFAYHIQIGWELFAIAGIVLVGLALLTVSVQSVKAAMANPVKSLKAE